MVVVAAPEHTVQPTRKVMLLDYQGFSCRCSYILDTFYPLEHVYKPIEPSLADSHLDQPKPRNKGVLSIIRKLV